MKSLIRLLLFPVLFFSSEHAFAGTTVRQSTSGAAVRSGYIFSASDSAKNGLCQMTSCWEPVEKDAEELTKLLSTFLLDSASSTGREIGLKLTHYKLKFFGFKRDGRKHILINGLCQKFWRPTGAKFAIAARPATDMGDCFFSVEFDVSSKSFAEFYIDGET